MKDEVLVLTGGGGILCKVFVEQNAKVDILTYIRIQQI